MQAPAIRVFDSVEPNSSSHSTRDLASSSSSVAHVVGNGWQAYQSNFPLQLSQKVQVYEGDYPRARAMIPLALAGYAANQQIEASALRPLYLRQPV